MNFVHSLIADDFLQNDRRHRPINAFQYEKSSIEPGAKQMNEIMVDCSEFLAANYRVQKMLAHPYKIAGRARSKIDAANEFLSSRFGGLHDFGRVLVGWLGSIGLACVVEPHAVGTEGFR